MLFSFIVQVALANILTKNYSYNDNINQLYKSTTLQTCCCGSNSIFTVYNTSQFYLIQIDTSLYVSIRNLHSIIPVLGKWTSLA